MEFSFQRALPLYLDRINQERSSVPDSLNEGHIELAIFMLFRIDIVNFIKIKAILSKEFHIQPSEIEMMPAWEYEMFVKELNNIVKEENERQKQEMDKAGLKDAQKMSNPSNIAKMQQAAMPKMPQTPQMPKVVSAPTPKF